MIPYGKHHIDEEDIEAVVKVLRGGWLTQGPLVEAFEKGISDYVGAKYAVAVSSATAGLHIAALAAGVGPDAGLITSPITFVASANAGLYAGAEVSFADVDPATVNMSADSLAQALNTNRRVGAAIPVHFAGLPCDMPALKELADRSGVALIEDAAHALGATYADGKKVGSCEHSLMTVFSFHPVKAIAAGEGGIVTTNDEAAYRKLLRLRSHGINKLDDPFELPDQAMTNGSANPWYYEMQEIGFHYRITDIQCALVLSQLQKLDRFIARRRQLAKVYDEAFRDFRNLRPAQTEGRDRSGHHLYVVRIDFSRIALNRAQLMNALRARGIGTQVHYIPVPAQPLYRRLGNRPESFPAANAFYGEALSIPLFYDLSAEQQASVIAALRELVG
jgi:perosamine synthetase